MVIVDLVGLHVVICFEFGIGITIELVKQGNNQVNNWINIP